MTKSLEIPTLDLPGEVSIPQFGLGVFQVPPEDTAENVLQAIEMGYRHIDTAKAYRNEAGVGQAVRASGLDRSEFFITTKCFNDDHGYDSATRALKTSLDQLEMEYVDLYLIHWPVPSRTATSRPGRRSSRRRRPASPAPSACRTSRPTTCGGSSTRPASPRRSTRSSCTPTCSRRACARGRHRSCAVSDLQHADRPRHLTEAWSPLAQGEVLDDPVIGGIAEAHGKTPAQVVLRWHIELGNIVFPKSVTVERLQENIEIFDFALSAAEMEQLEAVDRGERIGPDPDTFVRP